MASGPSGNTLVVERKEDALALRLGEKKLV